MDTTTLTVRTGDQPALVDLTPLVDEFLDAAVGGGGSAVGGEASADGGDGLLNVFLPHATAGVAIMELEAGTRQDGLRLLADLLPRDDRWAHRHGSAGHGADHVMPLVIAPSVTIPVVDGRMQLGTWQSVVLVDTNVDNHERTVRLSLVRG